jgi:peptidoglycan/LPS O-acetylase OafA/YrhL
MTGRMRHRNSFDTLRLLGAVLVIIGHSFPVLGQPSPELGVSVNGIGVMIFFSLSGYLITLSIEADPNLGRFAAKRALRILPALWVVVLFATFAAGPAFTRLPLADYFTSAATWTYLSQNFVLWTAHLLPGVFDHAPYPWSVNTSLWTLPVEVTMYVLTPIFIVIARKLRRAGIVLLLLGCLGATLAYKTRPGWFDLPLYGFRLSDGLQYMPSYVLGCLFAQLGLANLPWTKARWIVAGSLGVLALMAILPSATWSLTILLIPIAAATLFVGVSPLLHFRLIERVGDLSYGIYLWGWLVQQSIVQLTHGGIGPVALAAIALPVCALVAYGSWHLVEKPALRLKPKQGLSAKEEALAGIP